MHLSGDVLEEVGYLSVEFLEEVKAGDTDLGVLGFQLKAWRLDGITLGEGKNGPALRGGGVEQEEMLKAAEKEGPRKAGRGVVDARWGGSSSCVEHGRWVRDDGHKQVSTALCHMQIISDLDKGKGSIWSVW